MTFEQASAAGASSMPIRKKVNFLFC